MKRLVMAAVMAGCAQALSATELETLKAGSELQTANAEALAQAETAAVPAPAKAAVEARPAEEIITAGYLDMEVGAMERLFRGYQVLESREIYSGGDKDADLLLALRGDPFIARGVLKTSLGGQFPFMTVCRLYLEGTGAQAGRKVFLRSKTFFGEKAAREYQRSLPDGEQVKVFFTVRYNYREISETPFDVHSIAR